jgi:hypothetical protein
MPNVIAPPTDMFNASVKLLSVAMTEVQRYTNSHPPGKQTVEIMAVVCAAQLVSKEARRALRILTRNGGDLKLLSHFHTLAQRACQQALYLITLAEETDPAERIKAVLRGPHS